MRRSQCEVTDPKAIADILGSTTIGRLATIGADGYPYVTPVNFVFHEGCIYFHCAHEGEKLDNLARDARMCFQVDVPLAYLEVGFNPERNPCRTHQLYHSVIIRGTARVVPDGELKTAALNALVAKHESGADVPPVTPDMPAYQGCAVVEVKPERTSAKSDLAQSSPQEGYRLFIAEKLAGRGLPGDLAAVRAMGYGLEGSEEGGWKVKS